MTRGKLLIGTFVAVVAAGVLPAGAQSRGAGSATREPSTSGERTGGSAVSRGGDSGPSSAGSTSSSGSSTSGSSSSGDSGSSRSEPSSFVSAPSRGGGEHHVAPSHPSERQATRQRGEGDGRRPSGGSTNSGGRAVPRGGGDTTPSGDTSRGASASNGSDEGSSRRAVPAYSRPRDGRTQTGTAVEREYGRVDNGSLYPIYGGYYGSSYFYRSPYRLYYAPSYGFGLGFFYDPLWYDPYAYGYGGYGPGYGYGSGYGGGGGGYYGGSGQAGYDRAPTGSVRLKVKPREAQVYVDGFFVGDVDNFDGLFQKLAIDAGGHKLEVRAEGYEPIQFEVLVTPGETVTYQGELKRK